MLSMWIKYVQSQHGGRVDGGRSKWPKKDAAQKVDETICLESYIIDSSTSTIIWASLFRFHTSVQKHSVCTGIQNVTFTSRQIQSSCFCEGTSKSFEFFLPRKTSQFTCVTLDSKVPDTNFRQSLRCGSIANRRLTGPSVIKKDGVHPKVKVFDLTKSHRVIAKGKTSLDSERFGCCL